MSTLNAHACAVEIELARTYTLKRRAEQQAETRLKIVAAAVDLHGSVGPALTTFSMVAERAGVQRHTLYAHFADERSLMLACSGLALERDPLPDAEAWRAIEGRNERLRSGLGAVYGWYGRNADRDIDAFRRRLYVLGPNAGRGGLYVCDSGEQPERRDG